jgi:hypothetical protein
VPGIVGALHPHPNTCPVAEQLAEPDCEGGGHRLALRQDVVEVLAGNTEQRGDLGLALAGRRDHLAQQFAGVGRTALFHGSRQFLSRHARPCAGHPRLSYGNKASRGWPGQARP